MTLKIIKIDTKYNTQIRFIIVGVWNTIFGYGIFYLLNNLFTFHFGQKIIINILAMTIAQILAITNAYIFHKFYTFKSKSSGFQMFLEYIKFFSTYSFSFVLNILLLYILVNILKQNSNLSGAIILPVTAILSYYIHYHFTFKTKKNNN